MAAIVIGSLLVCCPAYISEFLYRNYPKAMTSTGFQARHSTLLSGFEYKRDILVIMFYPIFLFRRAATAAILSILVNYPYIQLGLLLCCSVTVSLCCETIVCELSDNGAAILRLALSYIGRERGGSLLHHEHLLYSAS
jgi:hypothetical protein